MSSDSSLEGNKIAAAVLVAGIVAMLSGFIANLFFHSETPEKDAYPIAVVASASASVVEEEPPLTRDEILTLIASASLERGERVAKKCISCHTFGQGGEDEQGPNLWNTINRPIAANADFSYSKAFKALAGTGFVWDYEQLFHYLEKPSRHIKGTKMSFAGLKKDTDRAAIIEYLRQQASTPAPLE